ncbi:serine hydrolase domain-containing protein [Streptosporangium subroseum]|uniref:serine hydrolase domain-containing protein n=1 Tax=Streptosporangium subroseum TaxID=106412 RepID=UPI003087BBB7|nr:beta-lactamase family protein [Streptosporangium subroseum]
MAENTSPSRHRRHAALALLLTTALTGAVAAGASAASASATRITAGHTEAEVTRTAQLTRLARQAVDAGAPGVIVRVNDGNGPTAKIVRQAPWTRAEHTLASGDQFRMGSSTKTVVATVILQLVAEHRLKLTDPVETWLPGLIPNGDEITLRMLLNHTSGLFNYINDPDVLKAFTGQDTRQWTPEELIAAAVGHGPMFAPGKQYSYSNTNYIALGLVAEKVTGHSLSDLIQERIARPLNLKNTYMATGIPRPDNRKLAHGYEPDAAHIAPLLPPGTPAGTKFAGPGRAGHVDTTWINLSTEWAAGGMVSTAEEWGRFDTALMSGKLLPPAQLKQMRTTVAEEPGNPNRYGLGLEKVVTPCGAVWGHVGQVPGYSSQNFTDGTGRRTVSIFTTTIFGLADPKVGAADQALVNGAVCAMLDKPIPKTAPPSPAD